MTISGDPQGGLRGIVLLPLFVLRAVSEPGDGISPAPDEDQPAPSTSLSNHLAIPSQKAAYNEYGRPLSIIESQHSDDASILDEQSHPSDSLEQQIKVLFETLVPDEENEKVRSIKLKSLPDLLDGFERQTGIKLLEEDLKPQIESFISSNAELILEPESVVAVIRQLQDARGEAEAEEMKRKQDAHMQASSGDSDYDTSSGESRTEDNRYSDEDDEENMEDSKGKKGTFLFPRSQSESADLSLEVLNRSYSSASASSRHKATSDPSTPGPKHRRSSAPGSKGRGRVESGEKDVLKGRGKVKAPPSAWSRPKPQALASRERARNVSDASLTSGGSVDGEYEQRSVSSPPSHSPNSSGKDLERTNSQNNAEPRRRMLSNPTFSPTSDVFGHFSRSPSERAFMFPRASPGDEDLRDAEARERWHLLSEELQGRSSGIHASPSADESGDSQFQSGEYPAGPRSTGSRRSSAGGRWRSTDVSQTSLVNDDVIALQAQIEGLHRLLTEKKNNFEQTQHETEEYISRMQDELDRVKADLAVKRKEEASSRARENNYLDTISSLESDLNKVGSELGVIKAQYSRLKTDHEELVDAMERHTARNIELREELENATESLNEFSEREHQWERDRESYRHKIRDLHEESSSLQERLLGRDEDTRIIASLQANIDALTGELEDLRNKGSTLTGSRTSEVDPGTLSKRLGSELAKSVRNEEQSEEDSMISNEEVGEQDGESIFVIHKRKRKANKVSGPLEFADQEVQTSLDRTQLHAPPTYDEASLENDINYRLHPEWRSNDGLPDDSRYRMLSQHSGRRCILYEEHLSGGPDSRNMSSISSAQHDWVSLPRLKSLFLGPTFQRDNIMEFCKNGPNEAQWLVLRSILLMTVGIALGAFCSSRREVEDADAWYLSNNLQVPWGAAALAHPNKDGSNWLSRLNEYSTSTIWRRVPT